MPINRVYCGWERPALDATVQYLFENYLTGRELDLSSHLLVFSGSRAGRRLLEKLALLAADKGLIFTPPQIVTIGVLPEMLYSPQKPVASNFESRLAWVKILCRADPKEVKSVVGALPVDRKLVHWLKAAKIIADLRTELSAALLNFEDAGKRIEAMAAAPQIKRWRVLSQFEKAYLTTLGEIGLIDREQARLHAVSTGSVGFQGTVILCAVRDLNAISRRMLDELQTPVISLIHAPRSESAGFDEYGCIEPQYWRSKEFSIPLGSIKSALGPVDQVMAVLSELSRYGGAFKRSEITIGYADSSLLPYIEGIFGQAGLTVHTPEGMSLSEAKPVKLLTSCARYIEGRGFAGFCELLRFREIEDYLRRNLTCALPASFLNELDTFQMTHLLSITDRLPAVLAQHEQVVVDSIQILDRLFENFLEQDGKEMEFWAAELARLFAELYPRESHTEEFDAINNTLISLVEAASELLLPLCGFDALELIILLLNEVNMAKPRSDTDIEALGWLELQLDDTPALVVCGMNEGSVPESVNSDPFLPQSARKYLGLLDNERRYAREAYVISAIGASREQATFIFGRQDARGTPLLPSRLLASCPISEIAERAELLYVKPPPVRMIERSAAAIPEWKIPLRPRPARQLNALPVTALKDYLTCPYRFYLSRILKLRLADDGVLEMNNLDFGSLGHQVVAEFMSASESAGTNPAAAARCVSAVLDDLFLKRFGSAPLPAVIIQKEHLRTRVMRFAEWNAGWRSAGWRTTAVEFEPPSEASTFIIDGEPFLLQGRIDRIDFNDRENSWAVFDYKFGEKAHEPGKSHISGEQWIDFQLPIYYHMLQKAGFEGQISLGYLRLCTRVDSEQIEAFATWDLEELNSALEEAYSVIRKIREQEFWPPADILRTDDPFAPLLGTTQFFHEGEGAGD